MTPEMIETGVDRDRSRAQPALPCGCSSLLPLVLLAGLLVLMLRTGPADAVEAGGCSAGRDVW